MAQGQTHTHTEFMSAIPGMAVGKDVGQPATACKIKLMRCSGILPVFSQRITQRGSD